MAVSGFEGYEKRLELHFSSDGTATIEDLGLRRLDFPSLEKILHTVQCTVVSAVGNKHLDSYVLSESSLFVYPTKIIIKTCGTTQLLQSVGPFAAHGLTLGLTLSRCRYTRGSFIFPLAQPYPHTSFHHEVLYLESNLPNNLSCKKASTINTWHVFTACREDMDTCNDDQYTVEICMTKLDPDLARNFFLTDDDVVGSTAGGVMTRTAGIGEINRRAVVCDYGFDPCGYSMNGLDGDRYSTIHVTPEDGFSYASFECVGSVYDGKEGIVEAMKKVVRIFGPGRMSVAMTMPSVNRKNKMWRGMSKALGMRLTSCAADEFPSAGCVVYQTFSACRK